MEVEKTGISYALNKTDEEWRALLVEESGNEGWIGKNAPNVLSSISTSHRLPC